MTTSVAKPFKFRRRSTVPGIAREMLRCFEDPKRHAVDALALDVDGLEVDVSDPGAISWCAVGAAEAITGGYHAALPLWNAFDELDSRGMIHVNNRVGLPALRRVLRKLARRK